MTDDTLPRLTDKTLYGRPMALARVYTKGTNRPASLFGLPFLNNGPLPLDANHKPEWHAFITTEQCYFQRLCMYCGYRMTGPVVHPRFRGYTYMSSGPGGHPTCMLYATRSCPHITGDESAGVGDDVVAYLFMCETGVDLLFNDDGKPDPEMTFTDGMNEIKEHGIPITGAELRALAKEYPER